MTTRTIAVPFLLILISAGCTKEQEQPASTSPSRTETSKPEPAAATPTPSQAAVKKPAEHAGKPAEHAGKNAAKFTGEQIKAAMTAHIESKTKEGKGVFRISDEKTGKELALEFVAFHTPREITGDQYFLCTDFRPKGAKEAEIYDLDFWLDSKDGKLAVTKTRIHKHPKKVGDKWTKEARYMFVDDKVVEIP